MVKTKTASARGSSDSLVTLECFITGGPSVFSVPWCSLLAFLLRLRFIFLFFSFFFGQERRQIPEWPRLLRRRQKFS